MDRRRAAGTLLALAACIACSAAAPTAGNHSALDLYDGAVVEGCYYNFQHYSEGDRIMTNEPCLNCTCHNRMLMCYLRVCPFTKAIGQDCTVEKRADQCCPIVTCPDVPVDLLTSTSTSSPAEYGATGVGKFDKYGCSIDGKYLPEGAKVPPTPNKPCEHCYCIRNMTTCVMQECTLHVDGCTPIYHKDVCCPVRYSCDHPEDEIPLLDDMTTTVRPTPGFILTTPTTVSPVTQITQDCVHDDQIFADGALIKTEKACEHCYCMKGDIVCVVQECGTPMENEGKNCTSLPPREGQCCPDTYICEGDESNTEYSRDFTTNLAIEELTTLKPPRRVGVEGSGYRNEPDEIPLTELTSSVSETEGSGEQKPMVPLDLIGETSVDDDQREHITEQNKITTESVSLTTQKIAVESETEQSTPKSDEGKEQLDIIDYEKSTIQSITEEIPGKIPQDTSLPVLEESETEHSTPKSDEGQEQLNIIDYEKSTIQSITEEIPGKIPQDTSLPVLEESETEHSTPKSDEGQEQLDIIDYEKSTIQSITDEISEKIPQDTNLPVLEESEIFSTESSKQFTEKQSEKETTEPYKETWKPTTSSDLEQKTMSPIELAVQKITTAEPDKKQYEGGLLETTSSSVYVEGENVTPENNVIETTTLHSKTSLESEIHGSTPVDLHTLTLEEVEKEEFEQDKHKTDTDKSTEEFTTESHEYESSPDTGILLHETVPHKAHDGVDEGFDKEITATHEFIPVTTGISTTGVTTVSYNEDDITEKEPEEEMYETPYGIVTNVPHIKTESTTSVVDEVVTQEVEKYHTYGGQEIEPSIPSFTELLETSISDINVSLDRTTEAQEYIPSIENTPASSSESTQKSVSSETISDDLKTTTITPALEGKDDIITTVVESNLHPTTASGLETSKDDLATAGPDLDKELQTFTTVKGEEFTVHDIKYDTSSELPLSEAVSDNTTTEPDRGLNTIPAGGIDEDLVTSVPFVSVPDSYTMKGDDIPVTTDRIKKDDVEVEKVDKVSTEIYVEKESSTISYTERHDTTELPEEKETKHTSSPSEEYGHIITDQASQSTTEFISSTTVPEHEFKKESSTELTIEKTDIPVISTVNQGENEIHEDVLVPGRIPGEGDCLQNGVTYRNESNVPSTHNCHTGCKCISSIIKCDPIICSPPPDYMDNCQPTYDPPDACCPTYECTHISKETMPPQSQSQMSGTEAPLQPPSFECRGDQCEVSEDKIQPTITYETCTGGGCKVDLDKKTESSECGPQGCHDVSEIPVSQGIDSEQSDKCTDGKCKLPEESCHNGQCEATQIKPAQPCVGDNCVVQSETLPTSVSDKCEIEGNCKELPLTPSLPCEGDKCTVTDETSGSNDKILCKEKGDCQEAVDHVTSGCEGESCRRKEIAGTEVKLPTTCTDTECLEPTHTAAEHGDDIYQSTTSVPLEDVTQTEKQIAQVTVAGTKEPTTLEAEEIVHETSTHAEVSELTTRLPAPSTTDIIHETVVKLESSSEAPDREENELTGTEVDTSTSKQAITVTKEYATDKPVDIKEDSLSTVNLDDYATENVDDISITQKIEVEHEIGTKTPELVAVQNTLTPHKPPEYTTESGKKEIIQHSTEEITDIDTIITVSPETIQSSVIEKGETTESYGTVFDNKTESPGFLTEKDRDNEVSEYASGEKVTKDESDISDFTASTSQYKTTESPKQEKPDYTSGIPVTESNTIDTALPQQFITEQSYSTGEQGVQEIVTQEQYEHESDKPEATGMEKQVTESIINVDTTASTTASEAINTVTLRPYEEISKIDTPKVSDKHEDSYQITTESLVTETWTSTKSVDSVVLMVTTPKPVHVEGEIATTKPEIHFTASDIESVPTYEPQKEEKLEFSPTSDIDTEEYVTEDHSLSGISEEKPTTTPAQSYVTDLESITGVQEQSEVIPQEQDTTASEVPTKNTEVDNEKENDTTESPKISDLEEIATEPVRTTDVHEQKDSEIQGQVDFEKLTTVPAISLSTAEDKTVGITFDVQEEASKEDSLPPTTEKMYTKITEKEVDKLGKPIYEDITTKIPESIPEIHDDIEKVTEYKDISLLENTETKLPEHFIPTEPDFEKSVTKLTTEEDEKHTTTTLEDKTSYIEYETSTKTTGIVFVSHSEVPVQEDYHAHEDVSKISEPATTLTSIIEASEPFKVIPEIIATEVPQKDTKLPEPESHATTVSPVVNEIETESSVVLELETKPTSIPSYIEEEQKITNTPVTSKLEHENDSKLQVDLTTEHTISELLGSTVSESEIKNKDIEIAALTTSTTHEPILEYSIVTEGFKVDKETDKASTSVSEEEKLTTPKITILPDLTPTGTEQPTVTSVYDYGTSGPNSDSNVEVSTELSYIQQTQISEFPSHESDDINEPLPEIYSPEKEEMQTVSPISMITEAPKVVTTTKEDINKQKDMVTESFGDIDKQKISPMYTQQTTERNVKFSEKESEYNKENTTPVILEYTSTPKHEYSEITSDLVELEEHTHKLLEESPTTPRLSFDEDISHAESTDKILEETTKQTHPSSGEESSYDATTKKVFVEPTTSVRPSYEEEINHGEESDKVTEDIATTSQLRPEEEIGYTVAVDKILEETTTSTHPNFNVDKIHTVSTEKFSEDTETTDRLSSEKDTGYFASTEQILEETATTLLSDVGKETSHPRATEKISEATITTLPPSFDKEPSYAESTDRLLEGAVTTPHSEEETGHGLSIDKILEGIETTPHPSSIEETSQFESTDKIIEETETTLPPSLEKVTSHSYATDKILEGTEITPLPSSEDEIGHSGITDTLLEETGTTERASIEEKISYTKGTDKILEEIATTLHPNVEKETSYAESTAKVPEDSVTTLPVSTDEEASHVESADKVLEETVTTQRFEEEISHEVSTETILEESATTTALSSEEKLIHTVSTEKVLEVAVTSLRPNFEEEIGQDIDKISEERTTTPRLSSEEETGYAVTIDKTVEFTTSHRPGFDKVNLVTTEKVLEDTKTTQRPSFEEEISHAVTLQPTIEKEPEYSIATEKILDETSTLQGSSFEKDISHAITTDKTSEDIVTTLRPISEDETIHTKTTVTSEVTAATQISIEPETSDAEITEKILEHTATTPGVSLEDERTQDESQKPKPEIVPEKTIDEQIEKDTDTPTKIKDDSETPVKEPTETGLPTENLIPEISSQPTTTTYVEESSSLLPVLHETDVKYTTEGQEKEISTETPTKHIEEDKIRPILEEKPSESSIPQEMITPGEEIVSATTKVTTMSIEEYVTTHAPAIDKFTKPKEKPTESAQSTAAPELPKPSELQPTNEVQSPEEESHFPPSGTSGYGGETDYGDEDQAFGPGTCRYGGKVYVSAQQIPRDDPCDFCFCFRSDIICLQQSCPPPIHGCHEEPIQGFCCPRYECPVSMATTLNVTTTTTTTTTTLPPHFPTHSYKGAAHRRGCQIKGHTYKVGEVVRASSGPCLHCTCGGDGQMKCDPKACTPEPMLRQMIAAAVSSKRRR